MSKGRFFSSPLGPVMASYIALKQALGRRYAVEGAVLESLDHFLSHAGAAGADLNAETFAAWCRRQVHFASGVRRNRMRIVRNLCLYRRRTEPDCFVPDPVLFPAPHQRVQPYIFNESEIARLLAKASTLQRSSNSPLCPQVFRLAIVLLYTTGLRRGELVRLTVGDYDRKEGVLHIRASKFHKSRLLPVPEDVAGEIERYLRARRGLLPRVRPDTPLLWNRSRGSRGYTGRGLGEGLRKLLRAAKIYKPNGRVPRTHDFRHSFAVNALLRWYRSRVDIQTKLPFLATYMGHVSIVSTQYYLHFIEPLRALASVRFAERCGGLITALHPPERISL